MTNSLAPHTVSSSLYILGVRVDDVTGDETLARIGQFIAEHRPEQGCQVHQICTVNPEFVMAAQRNEAFRQTINTSSVCIPDGIGILWAARRQGRPLRERVAGSTLVEHLAARAAQQGWRLYLLGAGPGVAEQASARLQEHNPGLAVVGTFSGSPAEGDEADILARIQAAAPDVVLVAFGAPAQDLWIARNRERLGVAVAIGVGGSLDFAAGIRRRAPKWVQQVGLEWLYRLYREPWRWRRQLALPRFAWQVLRDTAHKREF